MGYRFGEDLARIWRPPTSWCFPSRTDTFGLVNLEAMACGVPVAAYPVTGPIDVIEDGVTGALDEDLAAAARRALRVDPEACRERALKSGWDACSREFERNLERCEPLRQPKLILASRLVRESALDSASSSSIRPSRTRL
jgi:glycosyltransferase involved in cell wall biosynthesis